MRTRPGFTAIEMALATTIVGIVTAIAYPKLTSIREQSELQGAKRQVITQLAGARTSAIQRGRSVDLRTVGGGVWLTIEDGGTKIISPRIRVDETFGVSLTASHAIVSYDARGYATSLPVAGAKFVLARGAMKDSVCITRLGVVLQECGL